MGRDTGGAGGLTITEQLLLSLRLSGWPSALSPTLSSGCGARTWGRSQNRAPRWPVLPHPLPPNLSPLCPCYKYSCFLPPFPPQPHRGTSADADADGGFPGEPSRLRPALLPYRLSPGSQSVAPWGRAVLLGSRGPPHTPGSWGLSDGNAASGWSSPWSGSAPPHWERYPRSGQELRVVAPPTASL